MGNNINKDQAPTIQDLVNACARFRVPFTDAMPPEKHWNHDKNDVDEVYPGIFISGGAFAQNLEGIEKKKITHVLNTAQGMTYMHVNTSQDFYPSHVKYKGIAAQDSFTYDLSQHFDDCVEFMCSALSSPQGKILVHCRQGFSRSPTIVAVYLMQKKNMTATKALSTISSKRKICPNEGFMRSLIKLDNKLYRPELVENSGPTTSPNTSEQENSEISSKASMKVPLEVKSAVNDKREEGTAASLTEPNLEPSLSPKAVEQQPKS